MSLGKQAIVKDDHTGNRSTIESLDLGHKFCVWTWKVNAVTETDAYPPLKIN